MINVLISGGGRTGHLYTVLLKNIPGVKVFWHTRKAEIIKRVMPESGISLVSDSNVIAVGKPDRISENIEDLIPETEVVIFTQTSNGRPEVIEKFAKNLPSDKKIYIGAIPACSGFDWLLNKYLKDKKNVVVWGLRGVPATSPTMDVGKSVDFGGFKDKLYLGFGENTTDIQKYETVGILKILFPQETIILNSFLEMTLSPLGFIHPCVLYANMGPYSQWDGKPFKERFRWWRDLSELSAYFLTKCDEEQQKIISSIENLISKDLSGAGTLHGKLVDQYKSLIDDPRTLMSTFRTCTAFKSFVPMIKQSGGDGYLFKMDHAGIHEDVYFGMPIVIELANRMNIDVPFLKEIYEWSKEFLGGEKPSSLEYFPTNWPYGN